MTKRSTGRDGLTRVDRAERLGESVGLHVGYVSDERYLAIADALFEFERNGVTVATARSTARGRVMAEVEPGEHQITVVKDGYGAKTVTVNVDGVHSHQFRLLRDLLLGYMWPKWVKSGELAEYRLSSPEPVRLSLWRYGLKKEFVKMIGWIDEHGPRATIQVTPDGDYTQTGVAWNRQGYGNPHITAFVAGPERTGLYFLHAETDSGMFFAFPWVVAPRKPGADIAVVEATNTWNAYNNFGGRSNYINAAKLQDRPVVNARFDMIRYTDADFSERSFQDDEHLPLSFERPEPNNFPPREEQVTGPIRGRQQSHLASAEWRLLGWLEREGFRHDVYSEAHLHDGALDLDAYKVLVISAHPEYWTREMYLRVKSWVRERGGRLVYLGGNGLNCEVVFLDETRLHFLSHDPAPTSGQPYIDEEGRRIESRMHRTLESEANLLGVVLTDTGIMTAAPYRVIDSEHWVFAGTGLKNGDLFGEKNQQERIPGGASGHETDKMSPSSPKNTTLLAKGINVDDGGAEMVIYDTESGGGVFSAGSITYNGSLLVDDAISRITTNVLSRFLA